MEKNNIVILENCCNGEKIQLKLSNSALRLLQYLSENDWIDRNTIITEIEEIDFESFV